MNTNKISKEAQNEFAGSAGQFHWCISVNEWLTSHIQQRFRLKTVGLHAGDVSG